MGRRPGDPAVICRRCQGLVAERRYTDENGESYEDYCLNCGWVGYWGVVSHYDPVRPWGEKGKPECCT